MAATSATCIRQIADEFGDACRPEHVANGFERSQDVDAEVDRHGALVRQARESGKLNPRKDSVVVRKRVKFGELLERTEQALAEIRSMARTLEFSITDENEWDDEFREQLDGPAARGRLGDPEPRLRRLGEVRTKLGALATTTPTSGSPGCTGRSTADYPEPPQHRHLDGPRGRLRPDVGRLTRPLGTPAL